jgi:FkbM family methyltransferase
MNLDHRMRSLLSVLRRDDPYADYAVSRRTMGSLGRAARARIRLAQVWAAVPGAPRHVATVAAAPGLRVQVATDTLAIDVFTLNYTMAETYFPADVAGLVVIDLGAHKGYFGAWCLWRGAAAVYSLEPESANFAALASASVAGRRPAHWIRRRVAIGAEAGTAELHVSTDSWSHSTYEPASGDLVRTERVDVVAFRDLLTEVEQAHPGLRLVLKINVEGAAGDCLLSVPPERLERFDELFIDLEANTPQGESAVMAHVEAAGFEFVSERERIYRYRRR